ncbi:hypothetical protein FHT71_000913 [Rhizobium sp. BK060]|nr:hypothetical protein [Rhizobium sp. BK060]
MKTVPIDTIRAEPVTGNYWTPPLEVSTAEIHPTLMETLVRIPQCESWRIFAINIYDMVSKGPLGYFEIAIDPLTHRACGYFAQVGFHPPMSEPIWFHCPGSVEDAIETFYQIVRTKGCLE